MPSRAVCIFVPYREQDKSTFSCHCILLLFLVFLAKAKGKGPGALEVAAPLPRISVECVCRVPHLSNVFPAKCFHFVPLNPASVRAIMCSFFRSFFYTFLHGQRLDKVSKRRRSWQNDKSLSSMRRSMRLSSSGRLGQPQGTWSLPLSLPLSFSLCVCGGRRGWLDCVPGH